MHNLSRRHLPGTAAALIAGGLAACGGSDADSSPQLRTTLLVYLLGQSGYIVDGCCHARGENPENAGGTGSAGCQVAQADHVLEP